MLEYIWVTVTQVLVRVGVVHNTEATMQNCFTTTQQDLFRGESTLVCLLQGMQVWWLWQFPLSFIMRIAVGIFSFCTNVGRFQLWTSGSSSYTSNFVWCNIFSTAWDCQFSFVQSTQRLQRPVWATEIIHYTEYESQGRLLSLTIDWDTCRRLQHDTTLRLVPSTQNSKITVIYRRKWF